LADPVPLVMVDWSRVLVLLALFVPETVGLEDEGLCVKIEADVEDIILVGPVLDHVFDEGEEKVDIDVEVELLVELEAPLVSD
jgi:hypothetical protein